MKQTLKKLLAILVAAGLAGAVSAPAFAKGHGGHGGGFHGGGHRGGGGFHGGGHHRPPPPRHHHGGHRWHGSYGIFLSSGPSYWGPWYDPYPSYHSTVIVQQPAQPVYYANKHDGEASNNPQYWYYCNNPQGYYPYVAKCESRWVKVRPFPIDAPQ